MPSLVINKAQIDFKRDPKEWGNALYTQLGQLIDTMNTEVFPKMEALEASVQKAMNQITLLQKNKI